MTRRLPVAALLLFLTAANQDAIVAKRGSDTLSAGQLHALMSELPPDRRAKLAGDSAALKDYVRDTLLQRALLQQARLEKWDRRPDVRAALDRQRERLLADSFLASKTPETAWTPTERDVRDAYEKNKARFLRPRRYRLVQLFSPKAAGVTEQDSRKRLSELRARLLTQSRPIGEAAAQGAAVQFVDMGWVAESELSATVRPLVAGLQVGAISDPICLDGACHLLQLLDTQPAGPAPLSELHDGLVAALRENRRILARQAYATSLLRKSPVVIDADQLARFKAPS